MSRKDKRKYISTLFVLIYVFSSVLLAQEGQRYRQEVFGSVKVSRDLQYGQAYNPVREKNQKLKLDLYEPKGDNEPFRPAIVLIHGGGFTRGDKKSDVIVKFAKLFAKRGYVVVSINYRLSTGYIGSTDTTKIIEAVTMAYEDAKAAVRWLRKNATKYRIDTNRIIVGGVSAGAITALHTAYEENEGNSGNPGYSSEVAACISISGALVDDKIMESQEPPFIAFHGYIDIRVPYQQALELEARAKEVGLTYELHSFFAGHDLSPFTSQIIELTTSFLYRNVIQEVPSHIADTPISLPSSLKLYQNYPNPVILGSGKLQGHKNGYPVTTLKYEIMTPGIVTLGIYNILGQKVLTVTNGWHSPGLYTKQIDVSRLRPGVYFARLQMGREVMTKKMMILGPAKIKK